MRALLVTTAFLLPAPLQSSDPTPPAPITVPGNHYIPYEDIGGWSVVVDVETEPTCFIIGRFRSGATMRFGIDHDDDGASAYAVVSDAKWSDLKPDRDYAVRVTIDGSGRDMTARSGSAGEPPSLTIRMDDAAFAMAFALGESMVVERDARTIARLALETPAVALMRMGQCQSEMGVLMEALREEGHSMEDTGGERT